MRFVTKPIIIGSALALFFAGMTLGQKVGEPWFARYLKPASFTEMDNEILNANLNLLRFRMEFSRGFGAPSMRFDRNAGKLKLLIPVNLPAMGSFEAAEDSMESEARNECRLAVAYFPNADPTRDCEVEFSHLSFDEKSGSSAYTVGQWKNGKLTMQRKKF